MGSHDIALDVVVGALAERGFHARTIAVGSLGGVSAASRGECDLAPVHLVDPATGIYNKHLLAPGLALVPGWRRMQGFVFRPGDTRFEGGTANAASKAALADPAVLMVNRNAGSGTRVLVDGLLQERKARRLCQSAALAQRRRCRHRAASCRLGRCDRTGGADVRACVLADCAGAIRFPAASKHAANGRPCRRFSRRCATKQRVRASAPWAWSRQRSEPNATILKLAAALATLQARMLASRWREACFSSAKQRGSHAASPLRHSERSRRARRCVRFMPPPSCGRKTRRS